MTDQQLETLIRSAAEVVKTRHPYYYSMGSRTIHLGMDLLVKEMAKSLYATREEQHAFMRRCGVDHPDWV